MPAAWITPPKLLWPLAAALFAAAFCLSPLQSLFHFAPEPRRTENRRLATKPVFKSGWRALPRYKSEFEIYFNDRFGFRNTLVRWHHVAELRLFGISPVPQVIVGTDGWLFHGRSVALDNLRPAQPFTPRELEQWGQALERRRAALARLGARFIVVIAPDKQSVYPEFLPARVQTAQGPSRGPSRMGQLTEYLGAGSQVEALDLRPALLRAKGDLPLFHRTDTHWNQLGAYAGYRALMEPLSRWFPAMQALPLPAFLIERRVGRSGNLARMLALADLYDDELVTVTPLIARRARLLETVTGANRQTSKPVVMGIEGTNLPRAVMLHDSFGDDMMPLLAEHFSRIVFLRTRQLNMELIRRERPNVVIMELAEAALDRPNPE
jgi:hypothetical protein